jgi:toxin ParE1/3/4
MPARQTPDAREDLAEIWLYICQHDVAAADRLLGHLHDAMDTLAANPEAGQKRPDLAEEIRFFPVGNYLIFYTPEEDGITVIRVLHGARDYPEEFRHLD